MIRSKMIHLLIVLIPTLLCLNPISTWAQENLLSEPSYDVISTYNRMVRMRDGVGLATHVYRPDAPGRYPVIIVRNPYGNGTDKASIDEGRWWASRGYVYVLQNVRGRYNSEGAYYPYLYEINDGYDTQNWAGVQPWSNGNVGTMGGSYLATVQWMPAPLRSPYLKAMAPAVSPFNYYHDVMYRGGAFSLQSRIGWGAVMGGRTNLSIPHDYEQHMTHLPLITLDKVLGLDLPHWRDWIQHPSYDAYWEMLDVESKVSDIDVPSLNVGGWFDVFQRGTLTSFMKMKSDARSESARQGQKLIMGPWPHGMNRSTKTGQLEFGPESIIDLKTIQLRWFDYWLKGIENGIMNEPPVRIFVMGKNVWREENTWPLERATYEPYYFHSQGNAFSPDDGSINARMPRNEKNDAFEYDPGNPVPTKGGNMLGGGGPYDQSEQEPRQDVLTYSTSPLSSDLEVTGPVKVVLYASSTARDTDFTAKLIDVHPDGKAFNILDGIIRARYRSSFSQPELINPGEVYEYEIDLWSTSHVFLAGHRIRVEISSSNFPHFDRNPNTGNTFGMDAEMETAEQKIYHDSKYPSHIVLPVIKK